MTLLHELFDSRFWNFRFIALSQWTMFLPLLAGLLTWPYHNREQRKLLYYVTASFVCEYFTQMDWAINFFNPKTNVPYYHLITPLLFSLFILVYQGFLRKLKARYLDLWMILGFLLFSAWNALYWDGLFRFNSLGLGLYAFLLMGLSISYFFRLMMTLEVGRLEKEPMFWISAGVLITFSGNFLLWLTMNYLLKEKEIAVSFYRISIILGFILNIFLTVAFMCHKQRDRLKPI